MKKWIIIGILSFIATLMIMSLFAYFVPPITQRAADELARSFFKNTEKGEKE